MCLNALLFAKLPMTLISIFVWQNPLMVVIYISSRLLASVLFGLSAV